MIAGLVLRQWAQSLEPPTGVAAIMLDKASRSPDKFHCCKLESGYWLVDSFVPNVQFRNTLASDCSYFSLAN